MNLLSLKIFCDVVRRKSFSRAAAANRVTQSAASQAVLQLERQLGVRLIDRSRRPFQLTPEGQVYFDGCASLVDQYFALEARVRNLRDEVAGTVSVAAIYSVGLVDMGRFVQQFARLYPRANVSLAYLHPERVYESVIAGEADVGLISYPRPPRGMVALPWREEPMALVTDPRHRLAGRSDVTLRDLAGERFVAFEESLQIRKEIDKALRTHRVDVNVTMAFDNIETIKRAVELGEGVSILPEPTVRHEVDAGTLVAVPLTSPALVRPLGIIHRKGGVHSPTVRRFIDLVRGVSTEAGDSKDSHMKATG